MNTSKVLGVGVVVAMGVTGAGLFAYQQHENTRQLEHRVEQLSRALAKGTRRIDAIDGEANINRALALAARDAELGDEKAAFPGELPAFRLESESEKDSPEGETPAGDPTSTRPGSAPVELVLANMEASFEAESPDPTAARSADTIRQDVAPLLSEGSSIERIDCRTSMCRLESVQENLDTYRAFISRVTNSDTCRECFFTQTGETSDQRPKLTLYLARANHSLPRME